MQTEQSRSKSWLRALFLCLALVSVFVAVLCAFKIYSFGRIIEKSSHERLTDITARSAMLIDRQIDETFLALESTAKEYQRHPGKSAETYLRHVSNEYGFFDLCAFTAPSQVPARSKDCQHALEEGFAGRRGLCLSPADAENMERFTFCVPMLQNGTQVGVLGAQVRSRQILDGLKLESFDGEGSTWISDADGFVLLTDGSKNAPPCGENCFLLADTQTREGAGKTPADMKQQLVAEQSGEFDYTMQDGTRKVLAFTPLEQPGWYLFSNVSTEAAKQDVRGFIDVAIMVDLASILVFALATLLVGILFRRGQKHLENITDLDSVTGGPSRSCFTAAAERLIRAANPGAYVLVSADIQNFKLINDTFGSEKGDLTLRYIYHTISETLKNDELVARISADTFDILLKNAPPEELRKRLSLLAVKINSFNEHSERKYFLTLFQGIYVIHDPGLDFIAIQDRANVARKNNKHSRNERGNICAFYTEHDRARMLREKEIDNRMGTALAGGEFVLHLQPKVELRWDTVAGAEALARWQDPERGLLMPSEFIPIFEANGFIVQLDRFIFQQVCILLRKWIDEGKRPVPISVNLSRLHLDDPYFLDTYEEMKEQYRIPPGLIEIELTETLVYENLGILSQVIRNIHDLGFRCSLDDFGSGFSSLNMLKEVPTDALKLDRAFFTGMERDSRGEHVVASIIGLARRLKMETVCEGVERPDQVEFLRRTGCDMVQGYVFSPPLPVPEFEELAFSGRSIVLPKE